MDSNKKSKDSNRGGDWYDYAAQQLQHKDDLEILGTKYCSLALQISQVFLHVAWLEGLTALGSSKVCFGIIPEALWKSWD